MDMVSSVQEQADADPQLSSDDTGRKYPTMQG
jgi:hypothetical protein